LFPGKGAKPKKKCLTKQKTHSNMIKC